MRPRHPLRVATTTVVLSAILASAAGAPTMNFLETWAGSATNGWSSQATNTNPGTGGVGGAGDGFLQIARPTAPGNLGARATAASYVGDWRAAGIDEVRFFLRDVGADDNHSIHFVIGNFSNFWQYNATFTPPDGSWQEFTVDLTSESAFTHIIANDGNGFEEALRDVQVIQFRHDVAPFVQNPDDATGEFGVDNLLLTSSMTPTLRETWGNIKALYR